MSDLRARLADALREHRRLTGDRCLCKWDAPDDPELGHWEHIAGVLLSLPDMAIVDTKLIERLKTDAHINRIFTKKARLGAADTQDSPDFYRGRSEAYDQAAALLAAANTAESEQPA